MVPQPAYQAAAVAHYLSSSSVVLPPDSKFNRTNRAYPDIGAIGQNVLVRPPLCPCVCSFMLC